MHGSLQRFAMFLRGSIRQRRIGRCIRTERVELRRQLDRGAGQIGEFEIDCDAACVQAAARWIGHCARMGMRFPQGSLGVGRARAVARYQAEPALA